jgi:methylenetetrahydrofolate reductase (NADPH)
VQVIAMVVPLLSAAAAEGVQRRLGIALPERYLHAAQAHDLEAAWKTFEEVMAGVRECGLVDGVAVMTTEMDPPPETGQRIVHALRLAGIGQPGAGQLA